MPRPETAATGRGAVPPRWRVAWLLAAPHRLGFFAASLMLAGSAAWWFAVLWARTAGHGLPWTVSPAGSHGLLMSQGFMPLFMTGFLFTAGPKWLGLAPTDARRLLRPVLSMLLGWVLVLPGLHLSSALAASGLLLVALGWSRISWMFLAMVRASPEEDRLHPKMVAAACLVGSAALWLAVAALAWTQEALLRSANQLALWGFAASVYVTVSHRMIPFFSAAALPRLDTWRPNWLLWVLQALLWMELLPAMAEPWFWPLPQPLRWMQAGWESAAAVLLLWLALRWGLVQSLRIRLLAMLHGGFFWLALSFALQAISHLLMAATAHEMSLGLAPLHALTMGYLGATLLAMATRVSSGHGGRPLAADNLAWALYWGLQLAVVLRIAAALWSPSQPGLISALTLAAALAWLLANLGWALRYGRWYGRPRIDGRSG